MRQKSRRSALSPCELVTGQGFSSPNQPEQERTTAYRDSSGPESRSNAYCVTIIGDWKAPSGESRFRLGVSAMSNKPRGKIIEPRKGRKGSIAKNIALMIVTLILCTITAEGILRTTEFKYLSFPYLKLPSGYWRTDPELGVDIAPNRPPGRVLIRGPAFDTFSNELGCFDHRFNGDKDYILVVGDSSAWGYAALEDKWTTLLERKLGTRLLKCGVSGTGSKYQLIKARKTVEMMIMQPDVWKLSFGLISHPGLSK
jgi:hypothetical protein